jgi:SAM-dependent methyltransferase
VETAYLEDLAFVHDDSFGFIAEGAAHTLLERLSFQGIHEGLVVELAVGSGISSEILVANGYDVHGFDISADMIELARERAPSGEFELASLYDAEIPPCIAVTGIGEAFNYKFDPRAGFESMNAVFARVFDALDPGGVFLFDFAQPGRAAPRMEHHFWEGEGWHVTSETIESPADRVLQRQITTTRTINGEDRVSKELHTLALYDHEQVFAALKSAGFIPQTLATYSGLYRFGVGHGAFVAFKPPN